MAPVAPEAAFRFLSEASASLDHELIAKLSAPFLLARMPGWDSARRCLLVLGQETFGWGGSDRRASGGRLDHWLAQPSEVAAAALADCYADFYRSPDRASPFWQAHQVLRAALGGGWSIAWSNLMRVDTSPLDLASCSAWWNLSYGEVDQVCRWQAPPHAADLEALQPDAVLLLTGPHYDYCIRKTFDEAAGFEAVAGQSSRVAARVLCRGLPGAAFRTYHPNYLRRSQRWRVLDEVAGLILAAAP